MRLTIRAENWLERVALALNLVPTPLVDSQVAFNGARAIMAGATLGVFEQVGKEPLTADEVALRCGTHPIATKQLLHCLTGIGYLDHRAGRFSLPKRLRKWLVRESQASVLDKLVFQNTEWDWMAHLEEFIRTGRPLHFHEHMTPDEWAAYQKGMRDLSATISVEVGRKLVLPDTATRMLDIGGSHGLYSAVLCKKYPMLQSTILELPGAIDQAAQIVAREGLGDRVRHRSGDALQGDLGTSEWDLVFISNVVHHFSAPQNEALATKVMTALKPGGLYVVGEFLRGEAPGEGGAVGATSDLYFALTSASGTWSHSEIQAWMTKAGLRLEKTLRYAGLPYVSVVGRKP